MVRFMLSLLLVTAFTSAMHAQQLQVKTINGIVEGTDESGVLSFKGIPFAAPPVGSLRWKEPQPVKSWEGVRKAVKFGPRAMQRPIFGDMQFRSDGMSEDCLYLNVWTPATTANDKLPVLVYFYGGGLMAGDGSELRYDGEALSRKGIIAITVNYRLNIFGFFNHPGLSQESTHHASGNYGLLDQVAALKWVQQNIAAFGGDPKRVTIAGESAGSYSVSVQMASPLSKNMIAGAIGESGAVMGKDATASLTQAEQKGLQFADSIGARSLAALRALPADSLLSATAQKWFSRFPVTIDGYFLTAAPEQVYKEGRQAHIPLLAGWNSAEVDYHGLLDQDEPVKENYTKAIKQKYGSKTAEMLTEYPAITDTDVAKAATELISDQFIAYGTWKWIDMQAATSNKPVYRYIFSRPRLNSKSPAGNTDKTIVMGAGHSVEIEFALGNLPTNRFYDWQPEDYKVSEIMQSMFANFIKTGNPNGTGIPQWPAIKPGIPAPVMNIDVHSKTTIEEHRERYLFINKWSLM